MGFLMFRTFVEVDHDTGRPVGAQQTRTLAVTLSLEHRDTNQLRMPRYRRKLGEGIHSPGGLGTNHHLHRLAPLKAGYRTHSRERIDINPPLRPLHQPLVRKMSSLM